MNHDQWKMVNRFERVDVFSEKEYQRRIAGIRDVMRENGVQLMVFLEGSEETYGQWMLNVRFLEYIIVPEHGDVIGVLWNELNEAGCTSCCGTDYERYLTQKQAYPVCEGVRFLNRCSDGEIVSLLAQEKPERIGLVTPLRMTAAFAQALESKLPGVELVDLSIPVALFRAVKSQEELAAIQVSRDTQVKVFQTLPYLIREGRTAGEVTNEMRYMLASMGASGTLSCELVNTGATDDSLGESYGMPERKIQKGDRLFAIMEANGAGQQHVAFGRHIIFGEPTSYMRKAVEDEIKAHKYAASLMKADGETTLAKIAVKTRKFVNGLGYSLQEQVGWNWMHSLGSFIYEQYSVEDYTEDIPLREGIILHCHPKLYSYYQDEQNRILRREVFILNTYRVTKDGPEDLINLPFDPIILN